MFRRRRSKRRVITPAEMEGGWLLPAVGDRSATGSRLTGYNGFPFSTPVEMQGGHGFMAAQADKGLAWASNPEVITRIANKVKTLGAKGDPVYFPYTAMHPEGADFSHHVSDTLSEALKHTPLSRNAQREFNRTMKADHVDFGPVKSWPGVMSDNLREYLINAPGDVRNKFAKVMDTRKFQDVRFPSVAEARHAVTTRGCSMRRAVQRGCLFQRWTPPERLFLARQGTGHIRRTSPGIILAGLPV